MNSAASSSSFRAHALVSSFRVPSSRAATDETGLVSLSNDVLVEILLYLDCQSILRVQKTCKRLYDVTKERYIWVDIIKRLQEDYAFAPPEEGVASYSVDELEKWAFQRSFVQDVLRTPSKAIPRFRTVYHNLEGDLGPIRFIHLLPGGRWFLISTSSSSSLCALDLDSPDPTPIVLLDPSLFDKQLAGDTHIYRLWGDPTDPQLSFYVLVTFAVAGSPEHRVIMYHVHLVGHGRLARLVSSPLYAFTFDKEESRRIGPFSFNKDHLFRRIGEQQSATFHQIFHLQDAFIRNEGVYKVIRPALRHIFGPTSGPPTTWIGNTSFVYDNIFAVSVRQDFYICKLCHNEAEHGQTASSPCSIEVLHVVSFQDGLHGSVVVRSTANISCILLSNGESEFFGLRVPHDENVIPTGMKFATPAKRRRWYYIFGTSTVLGLGRPRRVKGSDNWNTPVHILYCRWTQNSEAPLNGLKEPCLILPKRYSQPSLLYFSQETGRFVLYNEERGLDVVDFGL